MHLSRLFHLDKNPKPKQKPPMDPKQKRRKPKLDRRNAIKNIDYAPDSSSPAPRDSSSSSSSSPSSLRTRSLDLPPYSGQTSFRVDGIDGEIDRICKTLGLSGPEDFSIPTAAWEARKARSSSDLLPRSRLKQLDSFKEQSNEEEESRVLADFSSRVRVSDSVNSLKIEEQSNEDEEQDRVSADFTSRVRVSRVRVTDNLESSIENGFSRSKIFQSSMKIGNSGGGINGVRPPVLAPPPAMLRPVVDTMSSTWDLLRSLAPEDNEGKSYTESEDERSEEEDDEVIEEDVRGEEGNGTRLGETAVDLTGSCSFSTSNDDDSSSTTTEAMFVISPNGRFKRNIKSWMRGGLLGSGSFGTVYEGISDDGFFFAVKEVSLLDQGSQAQQCIIQLEQEIALLSQFEHENIVQYLGTDKEEAKLYIFLELVTQGSLSSLYRRYHLRDSQVSAYTRQILNGLKYLHDRNVMHRDIKCANILVDASGSVKLADFGLAKETSKLNMLKSCKGSAYWMAPEVVNPRKTYQLEADIWSLGCTVLEMLTRQVPYSTLEWTQALFKIGRGEPPSIPTNLSKDARDFINQCLQVDPDNRPSASELLDHPFVMRPLKAVQSASPSHNGQI
ncbi:mitogen-activated protein kinase kinase kinase 1-like [Tasmannia lanceolata]|uniref:mitogen-activated protein kinase kinase kinase 1-like n=1 Tax=Tasmannia lanceolata TaxID=3420 RepID=UPI004063C170